MKQALDLKRVQIVVITWLPELYANLRFQEAAKELDYAITFSQPNHIEYISANAKYFLRLGSYQFDESIEKLKRFDLKTCNPLALCQLYRDKIQTLKIWLENNIPFPKSLILEVEKQKIIDLYEHPLWTYSSSDKNHLFSVLCELLSEVNKNKEKEFIVKIPKAIKGQGIFLIKTQTDLEDLLKNYNLFFAGSTSQLLIQKYYSECQGQDVRALHIKNEVFAINRKNPNDFRSNLSQGGEGFPYILSSKEKELCSQVFNISQLDYAGIDFLQTADGPMFLEINVSPGFEGIEKVLKIDIAKKILSASF